MFENVDGRRKPGYTITHKYKWANSKFNTSVAFFVATENETCIKDTLYIFSSMFPETSTKNVKTLYIFRQQYRLKNA